MNWSLLISDIFLKIMDRILQDMQINEVFLRGCNLMMLVTNYCLYIAYQGFIQGRHPGIPPS